MAENGNGQTVENYWGEIIPITTNASTEGNERSQGLSITEQLRLTARNIQFQGLITGDDNNALIEFITATPRNNG